MLCIAKHVILSTLEQIQHFLYHRPNPHHGEWKLDRMVWLLEHLNLRQPPYKTLHITGTNGKGSTSAMLESIYRHGGYTTGLFTSPHLLSLRERIQSNGKMISEDDFVRAFQIVHAAVESVEQKHQCVITFFEYMTAIALYYFLKNKIEVAVLEVGLGGRLDATNTIENTSCSVITTIAFDHEETLGYTLTDIAREKAGIIKPNQPVIIGHSIQGDVLDVIQSRANQQHAEVYKARETKIFKTGLANYQNDNAATAQTVAEVLNQKGIIPTASENILKGILNFSWPGRWQKITFQGKNIIFDGAHNEEGAYVVAHEIQKLSSPPVLIFGSNTPQRAQKMLTVLLPICQKAYLTQSTFYVHPNLRALKISELYRCCPSGISPQRIGDIRLENIPQLIETYNGETLIVTGSLYLVSDLMKILVHERHENWA